MKRGNLAWLVPVIMVVTQPALAGHFYKRGEYDPTNLLWPTDSAAKDGGSSCSYCESTVTGTRCQSCGAPRRGR